MAEQTQTEKLRKKVARMLYFNFEEYDEGTIAEVSWTTAPQARRDMWLDKANQILRACKEAGLKFVDYGLPSSELGQTCEHRIEEIEIWHTKK